MDSSDDAADLFQGLFRLHHAETEVSGSADVSPLGLFSKEKFWDFIADPQKMTIY